jgi:hypothetical protein
MKKWTDEEIEFLKNNYDKLFYRDISKELNRTYKSISRKCERLGIYSERWGNMNGNKFWRNRDPNNPNLLRVKFKKSHKGVNIQQAIETKKKKYPVLPGTFKKGIDTRRTKLFEKGKHQSKETEFKIGDGHWNWKGGIPPEPYPLEFNKSFKLAIKQRDGFMCLKCGMREEDHIRLFGRKEHIHHIDYDKELTIPENCCSLCIRCNIEVNTNRTHWIKFFQSLLSERYGYVYSEDGKPMINIEVKNEIPKIH